MFFVVAWRHPVGSARDAAAFAVMATAIGILVELQPRIAPRDRDRPAPARAWRPCCCITSARVVTWLVTGLAILVIAAGLSVDSLVGRPSYTFPPFATEPSLTALVVTTRW